MDAAQKVASFAYINEHFFIPSSVSSSFTGREREFRILEEHLITDPASELSPVQKRFVLYGLAGSGKTQTCCKFAMNNRNRYVEMFCHEAAKQGQILGNFLVEREL